MADRERLRSTWTAGDIAAAAVNLDDLVPADDAAAPEPELEAIMSQASVAEPFADGGLLSTPQKDVPPPIDPGAMTRTGSNRSNRSAGRTSASSPATDTDREDLDRRYSDVESELEAMRKNVHIVESEVFAEDLTATWHDLQAGITDWRKCLVSGSHLKTKEDKKDGGKEAPWYGKDQ